MRLKVKFREVNSLHIDTKFISIAIAKKVESAVVTGKKCN